MCAVLDHVNAVSITLLGLTDNFIYPDDIHGITKDVRGNDNARPRCDRFRQQSVVHVVIGQRIIDKDRIVPAQDGCVGNHRAGIGRLYDIFPLDLHGFKKGP